MAAMIRRAVSSGMGGWVDDDLAFIEPWGFDVESIAIPVLVRYGMSDVLVPSAHGDWLAAHVPDSIVKIDGAGHLGSDPQEEIAETARWLSAGIAPEGSTASPAAV